MWAVLEQGLKMSFNRKKNVFTSQIWYLKKKERANFKHQKWIYFLLQLSKVLSAQLSESKMFIYHASLYRRNMICEELI